MESRDRFSERERKVIELLLQGKSNKLIAGALGLSLRTVEFHLSNIYKKLGVTSRTEAALKLSEEHLRESTGEKEGDLRKSTVEKAGEGIENGENLVQLRRKKMKSVYYILISGVLLLMLIVGIVLLSRQTLQSSAVTLQASETPELASATKTLEITATNIIPTETPELSYQVLSPSMIKKDNVTFEASAKLMSCTELQFTVSGTFTADYPTPLPDNDYPFIVKQGGVVLSSPDASLIRDPSFGGGGGSDENSVHVRGQGNGYFINPPLTSGQKIHLTALVSFNELFGITNPVPFDLELDAGQCQ